MTYLLDFLCGLGLFAGGTGAGIVFSTIKKRSRPIAISYKCQCTHAASFHRRIVKRNGDNLEVTFGNCYGEAGPFENRKCGCQGFIGEVPPPTPPMIEYDPEN